MFLVDLAGGATVCSPRAETSSTTSCCCQGWCQHQPSLKRREGRDRVRFGGLHHNTPLGVLEYCTWIPGVLQVLSTQVLDCPAEGEESDAVTVVFSVRTFAGPPLHGL